jgi:PPOX class probable F420-dependent enzyme
VSRRAEIAMTSDEVIALLEAERILTVATLGRDGWPHLMPLWYVVRGGECWAWTYAKSQKVRNLERDPRCTLQVEAGERYDQLRGVMIKAECVLDRDPEVVGALGLEVFERYHGPLGEDARAGVLRQAPKRIAMRFVARETATWDHGKL